jgi:glycosyltransferase involved in cell wall biosynthesis
MTAKHSARTIRILFLFANRPLSLQVNMIRLLESTGLYQVCLVYMNRVGSSVNMPKSGFLSNDPWYAVSWPDGKLLPSKIINRVVMTMLFVRKILQIKPDVIHAWNLEMLITARLAKHFLPRTRIIFTLQDTTEWMLRPLVQRVQRWAYKDIDILMVTSPGFESQFLRRFSLIPSSREVVFIPNAPLQRTFKGFQCRAPTNELVVGYIGAFKGGVGITSLVQAACIARESGANVKVLFAGIGLDRPLVEAYSEQFDFVTYLGPYRHEQISDIYRRVDVLYGVYNQTFDKQIHMPYRLSEGICFGLPLIVAEKTLVSEIVEDAGIGLSVRLGDTQQLADALIHLCRHPENRSRMRENCALVRKRHTFESYTDSILTVYSRVSKSIRVDGELQHSMHRIESQSG